MTILNKLKRVPHKFGLRNRDLAKAPIKPKFITRIQEAPLNLVLFIGHHKVGSTSLQDYLARNAVKFARTGVLYPYVDFEGLAYHASVANGHPTIKGALPINIREPHNALAFRMINEASGREVPSYHEGLPSQRQMFNAIRQQVRMFEPHTVILAAEVFANFGAVDTKLIRMIRDQFPNANVTIVATLRRIDEYIASWHGQRLKFGHKVQALRETGGMGYRKGIHFNYQLMVEPWLKAFPDARAILRDYSDVSAAGGSIVDFFVQTGIQKPEKLQNERRVNDSLHRATYEIARRANHELNQESARELRHFLKYSTKEFGLPLNKDIELFGDQNRQKMFQAFAPIDQWLGQTVGTDAFFADQEAVLRCNPIAELDVACETIGKILGCKSVNLDKHVLDFLAKCRSELESGTTTHEGSTG
ncbi:hypothetical protein HJ526_11660 [Donghicola sp. C2-DW-16]|uniref:Uncharacterized protein n=1 Tax=Donghicola mangrovi TaxID=2729614 RepID=A0ABX2PG48_9RHOB|nr:hypothetical protein [Donghicola mangrovi]NVO28081.1 hypothetical protein [Donghicola mangrovi]